MHFKFKISVFEHFYGYYDNIFHHEDYLVTGTSVNPTPVPGSTDLPKYSCWKLLETTVLFDQTNDEDNVLNLDVFLSRRKII